MYIIWIVLAVVTIAVILYMRKIPSLPNQKSPVLINTPKVLVIWPADDQKLEALAQSDHEFYQERFVDVYCESYTDDASLLDLLRKHNPDLLHVHGYLQAKGQFKTKGGKSDPFHWLEANPKMSYLIFGTGTNADAFSHLVEELGFTPAVNIIYTIDRRDEIFLDFMGRLFRKIANGKTLHMAWHGLSPQFSQTEDRKAPDTLMHPGASHVLLMQKDVRRKRE